MSGTSADGIDAVVTRLSGPPARPGLRVEVLAHHHDPFEPVFRERVLALPEASPSELALAHVELGRRFAKAARAGLECANSRPESVSAVVCPGLTVVHLPPGPDGPGATLALGDGDVIAAGTGCPVLCDLRAADRAAGGHGAPLVPFADVLLLRRPGRIRAALNLGGIANVTVVAPEGDPIAFDTGPGNMLLDEATRRLTDGRLSFDEDGALGLAGRVQTDWLDELVAGDEFLRRPPPRSTGRERYGGAFLDGHRARLERHGTPDVLATLAAYTVEAVACALEEHVPTPPAELIVSGGGALNGSLMQGLARRLPELVVTDSESALGIPVLAKEALAFALLGDATLAGLPSNVPSVTGASRPCVLGKLSVPPL
jgi:anhydro-N-acetylmuramic acid kinase